MITKFDTSSIPSSTSTSSGSNTLLWIVIGGVAIYLGYRFIIKPMQEKQNKQLENEKH